MADCGIRLCHYDNMARTSETYECMPALVSCSAFTAKGATTLRPGWNHWVSVAGDVGEAPRAAGCRFMFGPSSRSGTRPYLIKINLAVRVSDAVANLKKYIPGGTSAISS